MKLSRTCWKIFILFSKNFNLRIVVEKIIETYMDYGFLIAALKFVWFFLIVYMMLDQNIRPLYMNLVKFTMLANFLDILAISTFKN